MTSDAEFNGKSDELAFLPTLAGKCDTCSFSVFKCYPMSPYVSKLIFKMILG